MRMCDIKATSGHWFGDVDHVRVKQNTFRLSTLKKGATCGRAKEGALAS